MTLPQLNTIMVAAVVLRVISLVNSPDIILILTGGGPGRSTLVLSLYAFLKVNREFNFGSRQRDRRGAVRAPDGGSPISMCVSPT